MDHQLSQQLVDSARAVFDRMLHLELWADEPETRAQHSPTYDVAALVPFTGDAEGFVVMSLPYDTARRVASVFAGADGPLSREDIADALGEITGIIASRIKPHLGVRNVAVGAPSVALDFSPFSYRQDQYTPTAIPFTCDCGEFTIEFAITTATAA